MDGFSDADFLAKAAEMGERGQHAGIIEKQRKVIAWFYPHAIHDEVASMREGRPIYHDADYVMCKCKGATDGISSPVTKEHIANFPNEWLLYSEWKKTPESNIKCLPGIARTPSVIRYCEDMQVRTIEQLAAAGTVQPELVAAQAMARAWVALADRTPPAPAKKRGGRVKGSKNRPKVPHGQQDAKTAA